MSESSYGRSTEELRDSLFSCMLASVCLPLHLFLHQTCAITFKVFRCSCIISVLSVIMKKQLKSGKVKMDREFRFILLCEKWVSFVIDQIIDINKDIKLTPSPWLYLRRQISWWDIRWKRLLVWNVFYFLRTLRGKNSPWQCVLYLSCLLTSNFVILLSYVYLVLLLTSGNKKSYGS